MHVENENKIKRKIFHTSRVSWTLGKSAMEMGGKRSICLEA